MGNKIQRIYIGSNQVRPSGPSTFSYDFSTKTKAQAEADGWTLNTNLALDSNGLYSNTSSGVKWGYYTIGGTPSQYIVVKRSFKGTNIASWSGCNIGMRVGTGTSDSNTTGGVYIGLLTNTDYKLRWSGQYGNVVASNSITWTNNTWYIATLTTNFSTNTATISVATEASPDTALVTVSKDISSVASAIQPTTLIGLWCENTTARIKNINVSRE